MVQFIPVLSLLACGASAFTVVPTTPPRGLLTGASVRREASAVQPLHIFTSPDSESGDKDSQPLSKLDAMLQAKNPAQAFGSPISKEMKDFNSLSVNFIKGLVFDTLFQGEGRDYARFYALETIARMPYFSYLGVLHLYETLGWWRKANYLKIHFAESWNEMHHLLIMEELGGAEKWSDRFVAQHMAVAYYWIVVGVYMVNPTLAYNLNQNIEEHAYATYDTFLKENEERLRKIPAPVVAKEYYRDGDLYMFDEFQTNTCEARRPIVNTLYDVFVAVRDDELEHVKTMESLQGGVELNTINDGLCEVPAKM